MKRTATVIVCLAFLAAAVEGRSIGLHLEQADLVAAGQVVAAGRSSEGHFEFFRFEPEEILKGERPEGIMWVVEPNHICCHQHLVNGARMLLFLRRMDEAPAGLPRSGTAYLALAIPPGVVELTGEEGVLFLEAVRRQVGLANAVGIDRARSFAPMLRAALEPGRPQLLRSLLVDAACIPGVWQRLDQLDRAKLLERFREARPYSELKLNLLFALGEARPKGMTAELVRTVRCVEGNFYRTQIARILAARGEIGATAALIDGLQELDAQQRANVFYVLGGLGNGKGVPAIGSVMWSGALAEQRWAVEALSIDRSPAAVELLGELLHGTEHAAVVDAVLQKLGAINTLQTRSILLEVTAQNSSFSKTAISRATKLLRDLNP